MCLTALEHTRLPQPGLSAQVSSKTPQKFLVRCAELLREGMGMPAMFNSDVLVLGMVNRGKTLEDARASSLNGCVACFCGGKDRMASSGYFNLAKCLELALNDGADRLTGEVLGVRTGTPALFATLDDIVTAFHRQVAHFVDMKVQYDNIVRDIYAAWCPVPFTSAVIDDCVDKAQDWHAGGSHYKIATMSGVAIGTVADSLKQGKGLAEPLARSKVVPILAIQLIRVGEETAKLDEMLVKTAEIYDAEVARSVERLLALLVPGITIVLGIIVALVIGSILTAVLSVYELAV
jgi:pyruvate-formate lyase